MADVVSPAVPPASSSSQEGLADGLYPSGRSGRSTDGMHPSSEERTDEATELSEYVDQVSQPHNRHHQATTLSASSSKQDLLLSSSSSAANATSATQHPSQFSGGQQQSSAASLPQHPEQEQQVAPKSESTSAAAGVPTAMPRSSDGDQAQASTSSSGGNETTPIQPQEWFEITDPQTKRVFYANPTSGECAWSLPPNAILRPQDENGEWWELFDEKHQLPYYYHVKTQQTEWTKPAKGTIIPLITIQTFALTKAAAGAAESSDKASQRHVPSVASSSDMAKLERASEHSPTVHRNATISEPVANPAAALMMRPDFAMSTVRSLPQELQQDITKFKIEGFATRYFTTHKRGVFRRRIPVQELLEFSKDSLAKPLLVLNKSLHKDALKCFKCLQRVMGEKSPGKGYHAAEDIQQILERGVMQGELRDEIYVQICKQLTKNPDPTSVSKGWEVMCCAAITFPPSKNFEQYLVNFIQGAASSTDSRIQTFAKHVQAKLTKITKTGPRGKTPAVSEIERAMEAPFFPSVFGETLEEIMTQQKETLPQRRLPLILTFLANAVTQLGGLSEEGIFRVPGDSDAVTALKIKIEKGKYELGDIADPNVPASLLKLWLRDLSEPVIPATFYHDCVKRADDLPFIQELLDNLPPIHRDVLHYMIGYLQRAAVPEVQAKTKMSVNNLAMVFAPNFLRCPSDNPKIIFENTKYEQTFLRTLINQLNATDFSSTDT